MMNNTNSKNITKVIVDSLILILGVAFLILGALYIVGAWNMQWSSGYLLIPSADDWNDIPAFAHYLSGQRYFGNLVFIRNAGHPQLLILLVDFLYYNLGFYSYQPIIAIHVFLQTIPILTYGYVLWKHTSFPTALKCLLLATPLLLMFDIQWWFFLRITQGYVWAFGYVFAYLAFFMLTLAAASKAMWRYFLSAILLACISCHFFAAAFAIWPAIFFFAYASRWRFNQYFTITAGMLFALTVYLMMATQNAHDFISNTVMMVQYPIQFLGYLVLMFGDNGLTNYNIVHGSSLHYLSGSVTILLSGFFILKNTIHPPSSLFERFIVGTLIFCFLVIIAVSFGRLEGNIETSPFHYVPCVLALYVPLVTLTIIEIYRYIGRAGYLLILPAMMTFLFYSPTYNIVTQNGSSIYPPSRAPDYERMSLILFSALDLSSFAVIKEQLPKTIPYINVVAKYNYGFARNPALSYRGKQIGKDILIESATCPGEIITQTQYDFAKWQFLELTGWAWNSINNNIPKLILFTDANNKIINTASAEMTQVLKQTKPESTWISYIPYEKIKGKNINTIKIWALTNQNKACIIKSYSVSYLEKNTKRSRIYTAESLENQRILP